MVTVIMTAVLFNLQIGKLTPLLVIGSIGAFAVLRWERLYELVIHCWPLLILPVFVCSSALWSNVPATTLYYGILYLVTVIAGMIIGGGVRARSLLVGVFVAFAFYSVMATIFGREVAWGRGEGLALAGLAGSKNSFGDFTGVALISTVAALALFLSERRIVLTLICLALLPLLSFNLVMARATSALVATGIAVVCFGLFFASRRLELQARSSILALTVLAIAIALATMDLWLDATFELFLDATGKDRGLTGRVALWEFGRNIMEANPALGLGYNAFWLPGNLDAEHLWRMMGISTKTGFSFHNTFMEIRVHTGWVGLIVFVLVWGYAAARLLLRALLTPAIPLLLASALVFFFTVKLQFEVIAFGTMDFTAVLGFAALAMGLRRWTGKSERQATLSR